MSGSEVDHRDRVAQPVGDVGIEPVLRHRNAARTIPQGDGRFDLGLQNGDGMTFIEVKSVTLVDDQGAGRFPDAV